MTTEQKIAEALETALTDTMAEMVAEASPDGSRPFWGERAEAAKNLVVWLDTQSQYGDLSAAVVEWGGRLNAHRTVFNLILLSCDHARIIDGTFRLQGRRGW